MNKNGHFNFGVANDVVRSKIDSAKIVIVETSTNMPWCNGGLNESVHIAEVDYVVETDNPPLFCLPRAAPTETDEKIAAYILEEIEDGACIQLGIGGKPNALGKMISQSDLKGLGVHTEMMVDAYLDMYEAGRITNKNKSFAVGKMSYTFCAGSQRLYDFMDNNPLLASFPVSVTNDINLIASIDKVVSINSALEIDLFGQVSSESFGTRQISGTGGQLDFHFGAYQSKGGKAFICLNATATDKEGNVHSSIRPFLKPGTIVTLPRTIVHYVVTEFGKAMLKGKSTWERAEALINIAHPDFREELILEAEKMGIWRRVNKR